MNSIIKDTLSKKKGLDKLRYFIYAYKGVIISILIVLIILFSIYLNSIFKKVIILEVKILGGSKQDALLVEELSQNYDDLLHPEKKESIQIDISNPDDYNSREVISAQIAAQDIDIIWMKEDLVPEFISYYDNDNQTESNVSFESNGIKYIARVMPNPPHPEQLEKILNQYQ